MTGSQKPVEFGTDDSRVSWNSSLTCAMISITSDSWAANLTHSGCAPSARGGAVPAPAAQQHGHRGFHTIPRTLHGTLRGLIMNCRPCLESQLVFIYSYEGVWDSVTGRQVWWWGVCFTSHYWTDLLINPTGQQAPSCPLVLPGWLSDSYRVAIVSGFH